MNDKIAHNHDELILKNQNCMDGIGKCLNKIPSVMSFGDFWLIAKIPNLLIHDI